MSKLLFDQNLPTRFVRSLADVFPSSQHVKAIGFAASDDKDIWDYAAANDFIIVSKDSDFHQLNFLYGSPPKTIWLRCGNCSTKILEIIIRRNAKKISKFVEDTESALLVIDQKQ